MYLDSKLHAYDIRTGTTENVTVENPGVQNIASQCCILVSCFLLVGFYPSF